MKHKTTFLQKYVLSINWDELIFDVLLIVYTELILYRIVTGGKGLIDIMGPNALFLGGMFINFFILWHLGVVRKEYGNYYKNEFILTLCLVVYWLLPLALNVGVVMSLIIIADRMDKLLAAALANIIVIIAWCGGYAFGYSEVHGGRGRPVAAFRAGVLLSLVPGGMLLMNVYIVYNLLAVMNMVIIPLGIIIGVLSWALISFVEYFTCRRLELWFDAHWTADPPPSRFDFAFKKIMLPFIVVTVLCLWEEIFLRAMILKAHYSHEVISAGRIIIYLILGGVIPVRVIMMFQPPLTLVNIAWGAGTLGYFVYATMKLTKNIF